MFFCYKVREYCYKVRKKRYKVREFAARVKSDARNEWAYCGFIKPNASWRATAFYIKEIP